MIVETFQGGGSTFQGGGSTCTSIYRGGFATLGAAANANVQLYSGGGGRMQETCFFCSGQI